MGTDSTVKIGFGRGRVTDSAVGLREIGNTVWGLSRPKPMQKDAPTAVVLNTNSVLILPGNYQNMLMPRFYPRPIKSESFQKEPQEPLFLFVCF